MSMDSIVPGMDHLGAPEEPTSGGASSAEGGCEVEVLLIRHAESRNNALRREVIDTLGPGASPNDIQRELDKRRSEDPQLSEKGTQQAQCLAGVLSCRLRGRAVLVVCSPMLRALKTIQPTAQALGLTQDSWWVHCGAYEVGGCYMGNKAYPAQTHTSILHTFPVKCVEMVVGEDEGWYSHRSSKETRQQAEERCEGWVQWLLSTVQFQARKGGHRLVVALVGHGEFMHLCLSKLVGGGLRGGHGYVHGNTGISTLHFNFNLNFKGPPLIMVQSTNDMSHLPQAVCSGSSVCEDGWWGALRHFVATQWTSRRVRGCEEEDASLYSACRVLCARTSPDNALAPTPLAPNALVQGGGEMYMYRAVLLHGDSSVVLGAVVYGYIGGGEGGHVAVKVHHVGVLQGYRRQSIASCLLSSVVEEVREHTHKVKSLTLTATLPTGNDTDTDKEGARAFFLSQGWRGEEGQGVMSCTLI